MAVASNRRERRRQAKAEKEVMTIRLLDNIGTAVTAGAYYDIMNTSWRGAEKCGYSYGDLLDWNSLVIPVLFGVGILVVLLGVLGLRFEADLRRQFGG